MGLRCQLFGLGLKPRGDRNAQLRILRPKTCDLTPKTSAAGATISACLIIRSQDDHKHHRHAVYASETTGLLLIAFLLLVLTLVRYWHDIHWSLR